MSYNYQITLTPLDTFFFGTEQTFGDKKDKNKKQDLSYRSNYYAVSSMFPQQTAILGVLRKEILVQRGLLKPIRVNNPEGDLLIGKDSFKMNHEKSHPDSFGIIKNISPLFLKNEKKELLINTPFDHNDGKNESNQKYTPYTLETMDGETSFGTNPVTLLKGYDPKSGICTNKLLNTTNKELIDMVKLFIPYDKVGIKKVTGRESDINSYHVKREYRLKDGFSFTFFCELNQEINDGDSFVQLGGERSMFQMNVSKSSTKYMNMIENTLGESKGEKRIILLSDAYTESDLFGYCKLAITDTADFRSYDFKGDKRESNLYSLYKRGSVFYVKEDCIEKLKEELTSQYHNQAGYNCFIEL